MAQKIWYGLGKQVGEVMMNKYRSKTKVIEAMQFNRDSFVNCVKFAGDSATYYCMTKDKAELRLFTVGDVIEVRQGDYIIKESNGEFYIKSKDIFLESYEAVE